MSAYQAKSSNTLTFDLTNDTQSIGKLYYQSWFKYSAVIEIAKDSNFQVQPKGFWGTTIEIKDGEKVLLKLKMNWSGEIIMQTYFKNQEKGYVFKQRGVFKESFILTDQEGTELLVMKPHVKWKHMNYEFQITTSDRFEALPNKNLLLMSSLHCANYYMSMGA